MAAHGSSRQIGPSSAQTARKFKDPLVAPEGAVLAVELPEEACPVCRRTTSLVRLGETLFCAACGYASDGAAGCT